MNPIEPRALLPRMRLTTDPLSVIIGNPTPMELWTKLLAWVRYPVALTIMGIGIAIFSSANRVPLYTVGTLVSLGFVLMMVGPPDADKMGYKF